MAATQFCHIPVVLYDNFQLPKPPVLVVSIQILRISREDESAIAFFFFN